ncbi:MBL fold metallo-hydrolase [Paenibacillus antri]|uniref:MBL fold metallo-hydrolase n=1 Tax=Paenibacillus antri TaxID=2582848 RepID=A0A5R9GJR0_9BACL|nr:MBL fold metallo-hydrolase [Paenibacillus antri]TLS53688.1 MBL fold metallo-hydrolase [Paenibacillus antri]
MIGKRDIAAEIAATTVPDNALAIWSLGQCGYVFKSSRCTIGIDLYISDWVNELAGEPWSRIAPPPVAPEALPPLDAVLCSHHHEDHMDKRSLVPLRLKDGAPLVAPRAHLPLLREWGFDDARLGGMNHGETLRLAGVEIKAFAAKHDEFEKDAEGNHFYLGYVLRFGDVVVYHAGDTVGFPELPQWIGAENVDAAFLPINGRDYKRTAAGIVGNMNYREAADLAHDIGARLALPMHYGVFKHNDENPAYFADYAYQTYPELSFHLMRMGERFVFFK